MVAWSSMFLRIFFPGNLCPAVRLGKLSPETRILPRGLGDASLVGIEYVEIQIRGSRSVILVSHGQMRTLDQQSINQWRDWGQANGISVLLHNYPGYGKTPGPVTVERILADLDLLVRFLQQKWSIEQISLLGNSLGCGPTIHLAAHKQYQFNKIVLVSPYTSCFSWGGWVLSPLEHSCFDPFDSTPVMQQLQESQVFMVFGDNDSTISPSNSKELFRLLGIHNNNHAQNRLCKITGANHKYTRLKAMSAIAHFLNDDNQSLKAELERLKQGGTDPAANSYAD